MSIPFEFIVFAGKIFFIWFFFTGILFLHECGHALALKVYGLKIDRFSVGVGIPVRFHHKGVDWSVGLLPITAGVESGQVARAPVDVRMVVGLAGPAASLATSLPFLALYWISGWETAWLAFGASFFCGVLNMLPVPGFDGYTVIDYFCARTGRKVSEHQKRLLTASGFAFLAGIMTLYWHAS